MLGKNMVTGFETICKPLTGDHESDLVIAAQNGSLDAFNQLVLLYQDKIYTQSLRIMGDENLANDITQQAFMTAYLNLPRFRNGSFRSWLVRIATNLCYDEHRRFKRHPIQSIEDKDLSEERLAPIFDLSSATVLPEKEVEKHELERDVQEAINRLDVDHRAVVVLIDIQEFDYKEAAHILGIPIGTVKSRLARSRLQLRDYLEYPAHQSISLKPAHLPGG